MSLINNEILRELINVVGKENYSENLSDIPTIHLETYADVSFNRYKMGTRKIVLKPSSSDEISKIVKIANDHGIPVIPIGGATTFFVSGGPTPVKEDTIIIDTRRMQKILYLDPDSSTVTAEAGITIAQLNEFLGKHRLWFPHVPESAQSATLGGSLSVNGIGPFATKYGQPVNMLTGFKAVLADGEEYQIGNKTTFENVVKIKNLFAGTDGCFGIITQATIKVYKKPEFRKIMMFSFPDIEKTVNFVLELSTKGLCPDTLMISTKERIYNEALLPLLSKVNIEKILLDSEVFLLISYAGYRDLVEYSRNMTIDIVRSFSGIEVDDLVLKQYWQNLTEYGAVLTNEMSMTYKGKKYNSIRGGIPLGALPQFMNKEKDILNQMHELVNDGIACYVLFPSMDVVAVCGILVDDSSKTALEEFNDFTDKVCLLYKRLGGTISAAVGIGTLLSRFMPIELDNSFDVAIKIKRALDTNNIMNPGKIF